MTGFATLDGADRYRVVKDYDGYYVVQKRGLLWGWNTEFERTGHGDYRIAFKDIEGAIGYVKCVLKERRQAEERKKHQVEVVWPRP